MKGDKLLKYIDAHCHVDQYKKKELEAVLDIDCVVGAAVNENSGNQLLKISKQFSQIFVCLGIHPEYPEFYCEFDQVRKQIIENQDKILAIGEIGLPYYCLKEMKAREKEDVQKTSRTLLTQFLDLSASLRLPVVLHAIEDTAYFTLEALKRRRIRKALFHWFEGDLKILKEIVENGYYISVSPDVLYNAAYAEFVSHIPTGCIVVESDGPWFYNGNKGNPSMIKEIIAYISLQRQLRQEDLTNMVYENTCELFNKTF